MKIPAEPRIGAVISYSYLWSDEADRGQQEGTKDRPAAIVMARADLGPAKIAYVLPVTHVPPGPRDMGRKIEIPSEVKKRLGLDTQRSWIIVDELNVFAWPGFDLRPVTNSDPPTCEYGILPVRFFEAVKSLMLASASGKMPRIVKRGE